MAQTTIGWTATPGPDGTLHPGFTFNGWIGCSEDEEEPGEMSEECAACYAREGQNHRVSKAKGLPLWGPTAHRQVTSVSYWRQPLKWNALAKQLGVRLKVFCQSLSDIFEDFSGPLAGDVGGDLRPWRTLDDVRAALWLLIEQCDSLDWLLLTKRPQNVPLMVPAAWLQRWPRNVWLGTTAGTKRGAARRIPHLLAVPGVPVYFVSYEPALEDVDFRPWLRPRLPGDPPQWRRSVQTPDGPREGLDWLIVGGESGKRARPFDVAWMRRSIRQCKDAGAPIFCKQLGANVRDRNDAGFNGQPEDAWDLDVLGGDVEDSPNGYREEYQGAPVRVRLRDRAGEDWDEWPRDLRVREWPGARP